MHFERPVTRKMKVSVPLRGKGRDQLPGSYWTSPLDHSGVSVPLRGKGRDQPPSAGMKDAGILATFPSPCGEKVGINSRAGSRFSNSRPGPVSVPLRGKGRDQLESNLKTIRVSHKMFPSPCGEKVGINSGSGLNNKPVWRKVSVPLRGKGRDQPYPRKRLNP